MRKLIVAAAITALVVVMLIVSLGNNSGLEVVASDRTVIITNVGKSPVAIKDVIINGRLECSQWPQDRLYTPHEMHVLWSIGWIPRDDQVVANKRLVADGAGKAVLQTGESAARASICPIKIVNAEITTDKSKYHFDF